MPIRKELLAILACPKCKGPVAEVAKPEAFGCESCNLLYRVEDDIPNFLVDEAVEWKKTTR